jgi:hypothetical protein
MAAYGDRPNRLHMNERRTIHSNNHIEEKDTWAGHEVGEGVWHPNVLDAPIVHILISYLIMLIVTYLFILFVLILFMLLLCFLWPIQNTGWFS